MTEKFVSPGKPSVVAFTRITFSAPSALPAMKMCIRDRDCFIYGGALTLELEAYLTDRIALLVNARERALFGSDIGKFQDVYKRQIATL